MRPAPPLGVAASRADKRRYDNPIVVNTRHRPRIAKRTRPTLACRRTGGVILPISYSGRTRRCNYLIPMAGKPRGKKHSWRARTSDPETLMFVALESLFAGLLAFASELASAVYTH